MRTQIPLIEVLLGGTLLASGCVGAPRLDTLPVVASQRWSTDTPIAQTNGASDLGVLLGSPELGDLLVRAGAQSPTLLASAARIDQARAQLRLARGASLPTISLGASALGTARALGDALDFTSSFATIDASYSLDFAGGAAAGKRSAARRVDASRLDRETLATALTAEIARTFVGRAALKARIDLLDRSIKRAAELQRIITLRKREGVATQVDVGLQAIRVQQLQAERERLQQSLDETRVGLALLLGEEAPAFDSVPADIQAFAIPRGRVPAPSQLAAGRSDVRAAEARIFAAGGDVAQARAAFFPRLDLSVGRFAQAALSGGALSGLTIGADLLAPIFDRNRLKGNLEISAARQREIIQDYRQTLLAALGEIENGLSAERHASARGDLLMSVTNEAQRTADLARRQYLEGDADLRQLLDAQDLLISAEDAGVVNRQERLEASILLFRATGGSGTVG